MCITPEIIIDRLDLSFNLMLLQELKIVIALWSEQKPDVLEFFVVYQILDRIALCVGDSAPHTWYIEHLKPDSQCVIISLS